MHPEMVLVSLVKVSDKEILGVHLMFRMESESGKTFFRIRIRGI